MACKVVSVLPQHAQVREHRHLMSAVHRRILFSIRSRPMGSLPASVDEAPVALAQRRIWWCVACLSGPVQPLHVLQRQPASACRVKYAPPEDVVCVNIKNSIDVRSAATEQAHKTFRLCLAVRRQHIVQSPNWMGHKAQLWHGLQTTKH